jgi:hypothetical protein
MGEWWKCQACCDYGIHVRNVLLFGSLCSSQHGWRHGRLDEPLPRVSLGMALASWWYVSWRFFFLMVAMLIVCFATALNH